MEAWNQAWNSEAGRQDWLTPDPFVVEQIPHLQAAGVHRVLDLGFGVGRHAVLLAQAGFAVYGIDASENGLAYAQSWAAREGVSIQLTTGDMATLPYDDDFFDAIVTWNVIYHGTAAYVQQTIREMERVLKPGGYLTGTLLSTRHHRYGRGTEIEPNIFIIPGEGEASHPHHYFDEASARHALQHFTLTRCEDVEQYGPGKYHWQLFGRYQP
ncbi:MAG: class I SAM-dependent methyltransferase [Caldilineaceae bacterium]|nr:class I SAM-dependent methyltransferase [Caldilineaceae bacterium]